MLKSISVLAILIATPVVAQQAPPPVPNPIATPAPDLADQLVRMTAAAQALYRDKQATEGRLISLEQDKASLEAKLNNSIAHAQALQKQIDDAAKPKAESTPTADGPAK